MIPIRLQSTDAGAPVMTQTPGALIALFDAFLVTMLGWTKEYAGTNIAVYRTPLGTNQKYMQVDDTGTTLARIRGYATMSDAVTGTDAFPPESIANSYWYKGGDWGYDLLGTNECFYFIRYVAASLAGQHVSFFGDFYRTSQTDTNNTMCTSSASASGSFGTNPFNAVTNFTYGAGLPNGSNIGYLCQVWAENYSVSSTNVEPYPDLYTGGHSLSRVIVYPSINGSRGQQGILPGMMMSNNRLTDSLAVSGDTFLDADGKTLLITRSRGQGSPASASTWRAIYLDKDWDLI